MNGRCGIDQIKTLLPEIVSDEVIVHDMEVRILIILFSHFCIEMFAKLNRVIIAFRFKDWVRCLSGSGTDLQNFLPRAKLCEVYQIFE